MMSRGFLYALGTGARKSLVLLWTAVLLCSLLLQYAAIASPAKVLANATGDKTLGGFEIDGNLYSGNSNAGAGMTGPRAQVKPAC